MKIEDVNKLSIVELEQFLTALKKGIKDKKVIINSFIEEERELQKELNRLYNQKIK